MYAKPNVTRWQWNCSKICLTLLLFIVTVKADHYQTMIQQISM